MDGIYEEVPLGFQDWADIAALGDASFDVVTAVETGRRLIDHAEDDCLAEDYTAESIDWRALGFLTFIALLGFAVTALCCRLLWQFKDALVPWVLFIAGAWVFQRNVLRRPS